MIRAGLVSTGARAAALRAEAEHVREVAHDLEELADQAEGRLASVQARMGPQVWAGQAAQVAMHATATARADLVAAASQLREVAHDLRVGAATMDWRAGDLLADGPVVAGAGQVGR